jgi:hypothetical protein
MIKLTKEQQRALRRVYQRNDMFHEEIVNNVRLKVRTSYLQFRRSVHPGPGCVMVQWCNMWLGIEPDGYTHS